MVVARLSRQHHPAQHQFQQQQQAAVFKVPTSSTGQPEPTGKRKLGEAFSADETMLSLSCGVKPPRPRGSKLTIFYAGSVNVFDNVPEETARALMTLAASKALKPAAAAAAAAANGSSTAGFAGGNSSASSNSSSCCLSLADITSCSPESKKISRTGGDKNTTTEFVFNVLPQPDTNISSKPSSTSSSSLPTAAKETTAAATATTTTTTTNPRMGMLPAWVLAGLPQARRNSVQRFLQTRRGKHGTYQPQDGLTE